MSIQQPGAPGSTPTPQDGLPGATAESVSSTVAGYSIERTLQGTQDLESVAPNQQDARIGGTGPIIGPNGVGNINMPGLILTYSDNVLQMESITGVDYTTESGSQAIVLTYPYSPSIFGVGSAVVTTAGEEHDITGVNYTGSGYVPILLSGTPVSTISAVSGVKYASYAGLSITGINYSGSGVITVPFPEAISGVTLSYITYGGDPIPESSVDPSGAGWSQSGDNILFTNGVYVSYSGAEADGKLPPSGTDFWPIYANGNGAFDSTGTSYNGSGWFQSGNYIVFTNNAISNYYFTLMNGLMPKSGETFYTTYTSNDVVNPTGSDAQGAGWYLSGTDLRITNGSYSTFQTAANAGAIPSSGETFYILYSYMYQTTGTLSVVSDSANYTMLDNQLLPNTYIPNVGNRFSR